MKAWQILRDRILDDKWSGIRTGRIDPTPDRASTRR
jgi:hypothetical protein